MVFAISDLHLNLKGDKPMDIFGGNWEGYLDAIKSNWLSRVGKDDIVLIAGDISWAIDLEEALQDFKFITDLPGNKVIIRGNHDYWWSSYSKLKNVLPNDFYAVQNNCIRIDDILICGTRGWTIASANDSEENKKIYNRELIRLELALEDMQKQRRDADRVIGMIHFPPFSGSQKESGFTQLFSKYNVDKVVYGHLHGKDAFVKHYLLFDNVEYYLTSCDLVNNNLVKIM